MIITKTPFRMSFFGGGTDIPEFFRKNSIQHLAIRNAMKFLNMHEIRLTYEAAALILTLMDMRSFRSLYHWKGKNS